ncbi:MAG TPA: transporter substrate-binding domain-containing protein [Pseudonocardiaceae bacterium]
MHPWPDPPRKPAGPNAWPRPEPSPGARAWTALRGLHRRGWLRPRRIGCLLVAFIVLGIAALWVLGRTVDEVTGLFGGRPAPVAGSPFDLVVPARPASSGSPTIDRITQRHKLIVGIHETPGLAQLVLAGSTGPKKYTGFDIALLELIARDLGVDPASTSFKPLAVSSREAALSRGEADLLLGGYEITPQRRAEVGIAGPYLVRPRRAGNPVETTEYGIGLPPGDEVLRERVTAVLQRAIDDGTWARLYGEYLGAPVPSPPPLAH